MTEDQSIAMGVDLGTTYSCVAIMEPTGPRVLTHEYDKRIFPSTFTIEGGVWNVGKHDITNHPSDACFIHNVKRILGRNSRDGRLEKDIRSWNLPFKLNDDGNPFCPIGDEEVRPEEFVALLLLRAQKIVEDATEKRAKSCVITVPAYFSDAQRRATHDAAKIAGMEVLRILNEPTAVGVAQLWNSHKRGSFLIIDAGGGTFDCSKLNLSANGALKTFNVEATSGDNALGGDDFLQVLANLFEKIVDWNLVGEVPRNELMALCEAAKKQNDDPIKIQVRGKPYQISQAKYKAALQAHFKRAGKIIKEAHGDADPEAVILAGGASCQNLFGEFVRSVLPNSEFLPRRPAAEVVAEGAAIMAAKAANTANTDIVVTDVLSRSVGIDTQCMDKRKDDIMSLILTKNRSLPCSYMKTFTSVDDKETEIHLYEGEHRKSSENNSLGVFRIEVPAGQEIKVRVTASEHAEILVEAFAAMGSNKLRVQRKESELTTSEIEAMGQKAQQRFESAGAKRKPPNAGRDAQRRKRR